MATESKIKLVVAADEPALFYSSVANAEMDLEAIDVRDGVYPVAYGPDGTIYSLEAVGERCVLRKRRVNRLGPTICAP